MNIEDKVKIACDQLGVEMIDFTAIKDAEELSGVKCQYERAHLIEEQRQGKAFVKLRISCFKGAKSKRLLAKVYDNNQEVITANIKELKGKAEKLMRDL